MPSRSGCSGCLVEKQRTTPDVYPLSLNSLRAACNQSTNRDPVVAVRRGDDPRRAAPARAAALDALRQRRAGGEVPPPARREPGAERRPAGAARGADAARAADAGGAAPARRPALLVRRRRARARRSTRLIERGIRGPPRAPAGAEGGALRAPAERGPRGRAPEEARPRPPMRRTPGRRHESRLDRARARGRGAQAAGRRTARKGVAVRCFVVLLRVHLAAPGDHLHVAVQQRAGPRLRLVLGPAVSASSCCRGRCSPTR